MEKLHFTTTIHAPRRVVWDTMLDRATYERWASAFAEGSTFEGSWDQGGRIHFLGPDGSGMAAVIAESRRNEFISIKHLGVVQDGIEDTESEAVRRWAPVFETYSLIEEGDGTRLDVEMDVMLDLESYMLETWPRALALLKTLCEGGGA